MDAEDEFLGELKILAKEGYSKELVVGFLAGATYPTDKQVAVSVAQVAATQEFGTSKIPARPFFRPAIVEYENEWATIIERHLAAGDDIDTILNVIGSEIAGRIQEKISQVFEPPLAPATLAKRRAKNRMSDKPLIDTGHMRTSVNYEIRDAE